LRRTPEHGNELLNQITWLEITSKISDPYTLMPHNISNRSINVSIFKLMKNQKIVEEKRAGRICNENPAAPCNFQQAKCNFQQ
jgi:hypothetical protein